MSCNNNKHHSQSHNGNAPVHFLIRLMFIRSFMHSSYSFNIEVDITELQTDREARKEDRIIYICSSS